MLSIDSFHFHLLLSQDNCLFMSIIYYFSFLSFNKNVEMYSNIGYSILPLCRWCNDLMQQLHNQHAPLKTRSVRAPLCSLDQQQHLCSQTGTATCWENCTPHQTHCPQGDFCEAAPHLEGPSLSHERRLQQDTSFARPVDSFTLTVLPINSWEEWQSQSCPPTFLAGTYQMRFISICQVLDSCPVPAAFEHLQVWGCAFFGTCIWGLDKKTY